MKSFTRNLCWSSFFTGIMNHSAQRLDDSQTTRPRLIRDERAYLRVVEDFVLGQVSDNEFLSRFSQLWWCDSPTRGNDDVKPIPMTAEEAALSRTLGSINDLCEAHWRSLLGHREPKTHAEQFRQSRAHAGIQQQRVECPSPLSEWDALFKVLLESSIQSAHRGCRPAVPRGLVSVERTDSTGRGVWIGDVLHNGGNTLLSISGSKGFMK